MQGVLYSHRSNFLHALIAASTDVLNLGSNSCFCALVPLFHANSWGLVFAAPMMGARLILPGDCPFWHATSVASHASILCCDRLA